jgi:hypothetical protein
MLLASACGEKNGSTGPNPLGPVFAVQSLGTIDHDTVIGGGSISFRRDGTDFHVRTGGAGGGRGFTVMTLNPANGAVLQTLNFDTWASEDQKTALINHLNGIPTGTLILVGVADDAGLTSNAQAVIAALESLGSRRVREYGYRDSWAMIVVKGEAGPKAENFSGIQAVTVQYTLVTQ